jgi:hypothetical protein
MVDSSRRRAVRAGSVLAAAALAGCSAVPSLDGLADRTARDGDSGEAGGGGDAATTDADRGLADAPHDLPLSVRATGDERRTFRVLVRTGAPTTDTSFAVLVDGTRQVAGCPTTAKSSTLHSCRNTASSSAHTPSKSPSTTPHTEWKRTCSRTASTGTWSYTDTDGAGYAVNFRTVTSSVCKSRIGAVATSGSMFTDSWNAVWCCQHPEFTSRTLW